MRPVALVLFAAWALPARAADPSLAAYSADGSRLLWALQLTDTHIDTFLNGNEEDRLRWALSEGVVAIQPDFVVVTGDTTDGTNGILYSGANQGEWDLYRSIVDGAGMNDPDYYFDLPGNHDAYGDGGLALFRQNSVQGSATGRTQAEWRVDRPWGSTCFVGVATPQEQGQPWPLDPTELTPAELAETEAFLAGNPECRVTVAFGHHDAREAKGGDAFAALCHTYGIGHYLHGHTHDYALSFQDGGPLVLRTDSLGQGGDHQVTVLALDHDTFAWETVAADDPWPLAVATAPVRGRFQTGSSWGNPEYLELPWAPPVPRGCTEAPVRVLLFDAAPVSAATFRLDEGPWIDLVQRQDVPAQWRGRFDASSLAGGWHTLAIRATGSKERSFEVPVRLVDGPCELGDEDPDGGPPLVPDTSEEPLPEAAVEVVEELEVAPDAMEPVAEVQIAEARPDVPADSGGDPEAPEAGPPDDAPAVPHPEGNDTPGEPGKEVDLGRDLGPDADPDVPADADGSYEGTLQRPAGSSTGSGCAAAASPSDRSASLLTLLAVLAIVRRRARGYGTCTSCTSRS
jgi:hypothetical protein